MSRDLMLQKMGHESLIPFCISQEENFQTPNHIKQIAALLEKVERGEIKNLMINMPPRHGKSFLATELFPSWYLGRNPNKNVILASYSQSLADDFGRKVRNRIDSPHYQEIFPEVRLAQDSKAASRFSTVQGGMYYSVGAGGALTGRGADIILIDDLIKNAEEARSVTFQKRHIDWYQTTLRTRLHPNGAIILVMTRWSDKDLASWILDNDKNGEWTVLSLPAISEDETALWPERYPIEELHRLQNEMGTKNFNALYQQKPSPDEGNIIKRDWLKFYEKMPEKMDNIVITVDTTFTNKPTSDYCAICVLGRNRKSQRLYLLDFARRRMSYIEAYNAIIEMYHKYNGSTIVIEESGNGYSLIETLQRVIPRVVGYNPRGSKESRISSMAPSFEAGQILFPSPKINSAINDCVEELVSYPDSRNDDFSDALAMAVNRLHTTRREMLFDELIENYDENFNLKGTSQKQDIKRMIWSDHDWDAEEAKDPYDEMKGFYLSRM